MSQWDAYAADWDNDPAARAYSTAAFESLESVLQSAGIALAGGRVLDFGCGTGLLTERLVGAGANVTAVDTSTAMLDVLHAKIAAHGWADLSTATELPTLPAEYELIVCSSVCSFLDDYPETVVALVKVLASGGLFVQWDWERDDADEEPHGLSRSEIIAALGAAGLEDISVDVGFEIRYEDQPMSPLIGHGRRSV